MAGRAGAMPTTAARAAPISMPKEALETRFLELLDRLQPEPKYLAALKASVLEVWHQRKKEVEEFKEVRQKSGNRLEERKQRLIEAFVYQQAIDPDTYRREMDRIRDEEVVTEVELSENRMDELDVDGRSRLCRARGAQRPSGSGVSTTHSAAGTCKRSCFQKDWNSTARVLEPL